MNLRLEHEKCDSCGLCVSSCPLNAIQILSVFPVFCTNCEERFCMYACEKGAIKENEKGVLVITEECDGCGACLDACPYSGIFIVGDRAVKCDLCDGSPICVEVCPRGALKLVETEGPDLGFKIIPLKGNVIEKGEFWEIVLHEDEKIYKLKYFHPLTMEEKELVMDVVESVRKECEVPSERAIENLLKRKAEKQGILLDEDQTTYLVRMIKAKTFGFEALDPFLLDEELEEIMVNGVGAEKPIYVYHRRHGMLKTNVYFTSKDLLITLINRLGMHEKKSVSYRCPRMNAILPDGSRVHAAIDPLARDGPFITIRKFKRRSFSVVELMKLDTITSEALAFLWLLMEGPVNMLIVGNTGSGKTTLLNALTVFYGENERIIAVEDTPEIRPVQRHFLRLVGGEHEKGKIVLDTLRMRPDRIIIGEIRSKEEMKAFIDTCLAGQGKGSVATMHARNAKEALKRLKHNGISDVDLEAIDLILVLRRWRKGKKEVRKVIEICEVSPSLKPIFSFDFKENKLKRVRIGELEKRVSLELGVGLQEYMEEIERRRRLLEGLKVGTQEEIAMALWRCKK